MTYTVTVRPSGREFAADKGETILEAALRQHVTLPYGCRDGACGSCKGRVLQGRFEQGPHQARALTEAEAKDGYALFCCSRPLEDLEIESREVLGADEFPVRKLAVRIHSIEPAADDVVVLRLQLPANQRLQYRAGQFLELILRDGTRRSYSMATAPDAEADQIELHVRHLPGGRFTDALFGRSEPAIKVRDILRMEAPLGTFFLREDTDKPILLLASGTGYAPIKAIIEHAIARGLARPMKLYWGCRSAADLYHHAEALALVERAAAAGVSLDYVPVLSDPREQDHWTGRIGFVHRVVMHDIGDLSGWQVYACGAPIMVDSAHGDFVSQCGLPADEFFADAFTSEADKVQPA